ncbi:MAG: hypothetical protein PHH77_07655 [Victivallaceae bacterium]|nr:hypothetical protein [Victivallaceae bacterium]
MNHSILVVICDFLVLSVLSLSMGVAPVNSTFTGRGTQIDDYTANILLDELKVKSAQLSGARDALLETQRKLGYAETRSQRLKAVDTELAKVKTRLNFLEAALKKRKGEIGKISSEQLLARLEKESVRRLKMMTEMSEAKAALEFELAKNKELQDSMTMLRQNMMERDDELTEKKTLLDERTKQLQTAALKLQQTEAALGSVKGNLQQAKSSLGSVKTELQKKAGELLASRQALNATNLRLQSMTAELKGAKGEARATLLDLSYARGRLSATEKELAESRSRLERNQRIAAVNELELREAQKKITDLQRILKNAVGDLSKTRFELDKYKIEVKDTAEKLATTKINLIKTSSKAKITEMALKEAEQKLQSNALEKYSQAAVLLKVEVREKRFLLNYGKTETFYLPEVSIAGKKYLISALDLLSGLGRVITEHSTIDRLSYLVGKPENDNQLLPITAPILSLNPDNRVCLVEVPAVRKNSLELLPYNKLRKRGLQNLNLFKYRTFGQESTNLNGRCSLGLEKGDNYLYIRNSVRHSAPQLKAEIGDFIITRQGQFVGIAVELQSFDSGRKQRIKCFVFPDDFNLEDIVKIPLTRPAGSKYFSDFAQAAAKVNARIKHLLRTTPR